MTLAGDAGGVSARDLGAAPAGDAGAVTVGSGLAPALEPGDPRRARRATGLLANFNDAGVLSAADVHAALRVAELLGEEDEAVRLAVALAVRAPRQGHVFVDLQTIRQTASIDSEEAVDPNALSWPEPTGWLESVAASPLVAIGEEEILLARPLRLLGTRLYLDRYWREERAVAADLVELAGSPSPGLDEEVLRQGLARLFPAEADADQRLAAATAMLGRLTVVAGGPGTGKTTTVARIVALLGEQAGASGRRAPLIALAAPTGKAAARLGEAVHEQAARMPVDEDVRQLLLGLRASTIHRLLGWRRGSHSRFAYDRHNRLPHDVVIVDETSMVSLSQMGRLVEAVRPDARLILLGDPGQLTSVEAGVVLGDIVGPAVERPVRSAGARRRIGAAVGQEVREGGAGGADSPPSPVADGIVVLERGHRYGVEIGKLAEAIRRGDATAVLEQLRSGSSRVRWIELDPEQEPEQADALDPVRECAVASGVRLVEAARDGEATVALEALGEFRLLCAHRRGPHGVSRWASEVQGWIGGELSDLDVDRRDYVGRPLLVTRNDYELGLFNGDTGVIVSQDGRASATFERGGHLLRFSPLRLSAVETLYAMTIHKSQGSQFDTAAVLLPPPESRILTRELLYTAVTRARERLVLVGTETSVRAALERPVARASGLRERLWGAAA